MIWPPSVFRTYNERKEKALATETGVVVYSANSEPFFDMETLCDYLGTDVEFLQAVLTNIKACYHTFYIDKDTKKITPYKEGLRLREVNAPCKGLKRWQLRLMEFFNVFPKHDCNYAFMEGKNIKAAAESIADKDTLLHIDLKDFFPSHSVLYLLNCLSKLVKAKGWVISKDALNAVVRLCCLNNHCLPQGSPASPLLTIICNYRMDERLKAVATKYGLEYSRYADDLWFGSPTPFKFNLKQCINDLKDAVHPFNINFKKLNVMRERAVPLLEGYKVTPSRLLTSTQWGILTNEIKSKLPNGVTAKLSSTNGKILIEFDTRPEIPADEIKAFGNALVTTESDKLQGITFAVKPKLFYIQSVKKCLGMHLTGDQVKFPRKKFNELRLHAFLMGRQRAMFRFANRHKGNELSFAVDRVLRAFSERKTSGAKNFRNMYKQPMNRRVFNGKVAFLASIDPEKAAKIRAEEEQSFRRCSEQLRNYCVTNGLGNMLGY